MSRLRFLASFALLLGGCVYQAPPDVELERPVGGVFELGTPLVLSFNEPIDPGTLAIRVWPGDRDQENELRRGLKPRLEKCTPGTSPCRSNTLVVAKDRLSATVTLDPEDTGKVDVPLVLEVMPGLTGASGRTRVISTWFDIQFAPPLPPVTETPDAGGDVGPDVAPERPMELEEGTYIILGQIEKPLPAILTLITHVKVLPDGRGALAGVEGDETGGAPKNTNDPEHLMVDTTKEGFAAFMTARFDWDGDNRIMTTEPIDLKVLVGPLTVNLYQIRLKGFVVQKDGHDRIEGTLSFEGVMLDFGNATQDYDADTTTFEASFVPPDKVPPGVPDLCGNLCGAVELGVCDPPEGFPGDDFCE